MSQQAIWKDLVRKSFRQNYKFSVEAQHNWFPGHMHKGLGQIQRRMADVDCVLEVHDARVPFSGRNLTFRENLNKSRPHILLLNKQDLFPEMAHSIITGLTNLFVQKNNECFRLLLL